MGNKNKLKTGQLIALIAILILNLIWIACSTITRIKMLGTLPLNQIANIVMFAIVVYYVCYSYKKPHGNLMRYLVLCCAALEAFQYINSIITYPSYMYYIFYAVTILKAHMAGRLDHYKQNIIISAIVLVCECLILYCLTSALVSFGVQNLVVPFMSMMGPVTLWLDIAFAYVLRYKEHKEAGLADK